MDNVMSIVSLSQLDTTLKVNEFYLQLVKMNQRYSE